MFAYSPHVWPLILASFFCVGVGRYARRYPDVPASRPLVALTWLCVLWTSFYAVSISVVDLRLGSLVSTFIAVPTQLIPPTCLILAILYTGKERILTRRNQILIFSLPILAIVASFTRSLHHLFRFDYRVDTGGPVAILEGTGGPIYWITLVYANLLVLVALGFLLYGLADRSLRARNTLLLIIGLLVPVTINILFSLGFTPIYGYNFAPMSIAVSALAYLWALLRHRLFGIAPIARSTVVDNISDLVIVFDMHGHIIDFNAAARIVCGLDPKTSIGASSDSLGPVWANFFRSCSLLSSCVDEAAIIVDGIERFFDLTISPIEDYRKRVVGRLFVLHDVTERRAAQSQIHKLLEEKELLLLEVHHRIKNNMSVIASILSLQADALKDSPAYDALQDAKRRVMSMMVLYDRLYRSSDGGDMSIQDYLSPLLDRIMKSVGDEAVVEIRKDIQDFSVSSRTLLPIGIIANELLTNAMKHAFIGRPHGVVTVSATLSEDGKRATLSIADDGIGLQEDVWGGASKGFGLQLVGALMEQVSGQIDIQRSSGTRFALEFDPGYNELHGKS